MEIRAQPSPKAAILKRRIFIQLAVLSFIGIAAVLLIPHEPTYKGKKISFWLNEWKHPWDRRRQAKVAFEAIGTNCLPHLAKILTKADAPWKAKLRSSLDKRGFKSIPSFLQPPALRDMSILAIKHLGTNASPLIPLLSSHINSAESGFWCLLALSAIGESAAPALELACQSTDHRLRIRAAYYLAMFKAQKPLEVSYQQNPVLLNFFKRGPAIWVCKMESNGDWLVDFNEPYDSQRENLLENLKHTNAAVREASSEALSLIPAPPPLLRDSDKIRNEMKQIEKLKRMLLERNAS